MFPNFDDVLVRFLQQESISVLWDIGANTGQFGQMVRKAGYRGRLISCEPLSDAFATLQQYIYDDPHWMAIKVAVGDQRGTATLQISRNSVSSSLRTMNQTHLDAAPKSRIIGAEVCEVCTLDELWREYCTDQDRALLKIDTQGYESQVLDGAQGCIDQVQGILIELSFVELYEGQATFIEQYERLLRMGFFPAALQPVFMNRDHLELLQADWLFKRRDMEAK